MRGKSNRISAVVYFVNWQAIHVVFAGGSFQAPSVSKLEICRASGMQKLFGSLSVSFASLKCIRCQWTQKTTQSGLVKAPPQGSRPMLMAVRCILGQPSIPRSRTDWKSANGHLAGSHVLMGRQGKLSQRNVVGNKLCCSSPELFDRSLIEAREEGKRKNVPYCTSITQTIPEYMGGGVGK